MSRPRIRDGRGETIIPAETIVGAAHVTPPIRKQGPYAWDLEQIRSARDLQLRGDFEIPVRLAEAFRTDDALFFAYISRVATQSSVPLQWRPSTTATGSAVSERMTRAVRLPTHVRQSLLGTVANHGIAVGFLQRSVIDDPDNGPTVQLTLNEWPLEHVKFFPYDNSIKTRTREIPSYVTITHGDGFWVVFRKFGMTPWSQDACVLPASFIWAAHAGAVSDWAGASFSHGQPKLMGELPPGVRLGNEDGTGLSNDATAYLNLLVQIASGETVAGIRPPGAKSDLLFNGSTAWQVFSELGISRERAAARVYCGTDAILGAMGGAPGVDSAQLFQVADTRLESDAEMLERGFWEGVCLPWCALHGIDPEDAAVPKYALPDAETDRRSEQEASAIDRMMKAIAALRESGVTVTQNTVDQMRKIFGVATPMMLAAGTSTVQLTPTSLAEIVTVREARASQGLPPLGDERDDKMVAEVGKGASGAPPGGDPNDPNAPPGEDPNAADSGDGTDNGGDAPPPPIPTGDDGSDPTLNTFASKPTHTGPKGGLYYIGASGKKVYVKGAGGDTPKKADGSAPAKSPAHKTPESDDATKTPEAAAPGHSVARPQPKKPRAKPSTPRRGSTPGSHEEAVAYAQKHWAESFTVPEGIDASHVHAHLKRLGADKLLRGKKIDEIHLSCETAPGKFKAGKVKPGQIPDDALGLYSNENLRGGQSFLKVSKDAKNHAQIELPHGSSPIGSAHQIAETVNDQFGAILTHEWGHAVHMHPDGEQLAAIDHNIRAAFRAPDREQISEYANADHREYFAESYTAYVYHKAELRRDAPKAYRMVELVLSLRGIKT